MNSVDIVGACPGLTYRKLDHWCHAGIFGPAKVAPTSGSKRAFTTEDLCVAKALARVSCALDEWSGGRGGNVRMYREIANQIREGVPVVQISLAPGMRFELHLDDGEHIHVR